MSLHDQSEPLIIGIHADALAEKILIAQYRGWMYGDAGQDLDLLDCSWVTLGTSLSFESAKAIFSECYIFMRVLRKQACRTIAWRNDLKPGICDDECRMLRLIAASQAHDSFAEISVAAELLGTHKVGALLTVSRSLAQALELRRMMLEPIIEVTASEFSGFAQGSMLIH